MSKRLSIDAVVRCLANEHFGIEPELERIVWFRGDGEREIRLLEINRSTVATGRVEVFSFPPSADIPYPVRIAEISPDEWERVKAGQIQLPEGWNLRDTQDFPRQGAAR